MSGIGTPKVNKDSPNFNNDHKEDHREYLIIRSHFSPGTNLLVNVRIPDLGTKSHIRTNLIKVLTAHKNTKKKNYINLKLE